MDTDISLKVINVKVDFHFPRQDSDETFGTEKASGNVGLEAENGNWPHANETWAPIVFYAKMDLEIYKQNREKDRNSNSLIPRE